MIMTKHRPPLGYRAAIDWILDNDDTYFLDDEECGIISVAASMVGDIYDRTDEEVVADLRKRRAKINSTKI